MRFVRVKSFAGQANETEMLLHLCAEYEIIVKFNTLDKYDIKRFERASKKSTMCHMSTSVCDKVMVVKRKIRL